MNERKCFILKEVEIPFNDLKAGQMFRLEDSSGYSEPNWAIALEDAKLNERSVGVVQCQNVAIASLKTPKF